MSESGGAYRPTIPNEQLFKKFKDRLFGSDEFAAKQPLDADLTALAALGSTGFVVRTAANTYALRTLEESGTFATITNPAGTAGNPSIAFSLVDQWSWFIEFPEDKDYDLIINSSYACTINSVTTDCTAGTGTLTGKINTTALGGTANSVSTTESEQTHSSANSLAAGDNFRITMSATSGLENMSVTVKITRTL